LWLLISGYMVFEIRDFQNNALGLEGLLDDTTLRDQRERDRFHTNYVEQVGKIVGFKRTKQEPKSLSKLEKAIFNGIYEEYLSNSRLNRYFGSYARFFNAFFVAPYGIEYKDGMYVDALPPDVAQSGSAPLSDEQERVKKKREVQQFVRSINLPGLLHSCLCHERPRVCSDEDLTRKTLEYVRGKEKKQLPLVTELPKSVWDILFSETGDCLSIKAERKERSEGKVPIVKFGEFWFASMLHYLHPHIHYLLIKTTDPGLPSPLYRIKLMEAEQSIWDTKTLIVGGLMGEDLSKFKGAGVEEFFKDAITQFFLKVVGRAFTPEGKQIGYTNNIFYNETHQEKEDDPCNQFTAYLRNKYVDNKGNKKMGSVVYPCNEEGSAIYPSQVDGEHKWALSVIGRIQDSSAISNLGPNDNLLFYGEQYAETFFQNRNKMLPGSFGNLGGEVNGFFYVPPPEKKSPPPKKMSLAKKLAIGGLAVFGAVAGYFMLRDACKSQDGSEVSTESDANVDNMTTHNDWRVGPYINRFGQPAFGPHSDDPVFGNTNNKGTYVDGGGPWSEVSKDVSHTSSSHVDAGVDGFGDDEVSDITETDSIPTPFCSEVPPDPRLPTGTKIAKRLDFDGDGKSDLVTWKNEELLIDLSSVGHFGLWNVDMKYDPLPGKHIWPFMEDMDSDGREDVVLYATDTGTWYMKLTRWPLTNEMQISNWDRIISTGVGSACKSVLSTDPKGGIYGRPLPGDYNADGWVDLAVVCSDGFWRIDYGGPGCADYGQVDDEIMFLDEQRLAQAPGWAYIPVFDEVPGGRRVLAYKIPDGLPHAGQLVVVRAYGTDWSGLLPTPLGGNGVIVVPGRHAGPASTSISLKDSAGNWGLYTTDGSVLPAQPLKGYGGNICIPVLGDFDGDGIDDPTVTCPDKWIVSYSRADMPHDSDGVSIIHLPQPIVAGVSPILPGVSYFGGANYSFVQQLRSYFIETNPGKPIPIPVDMVRTSVNYALMETQAGIARPYYVVNPSNNGNK
jgi:hypothetical protein